MNDNQGLAGSIVAYTLSSGAGIYIVRWLGKNFFDWLKSYNERLKTLEKSVVTFEGKMDVRLTRIETSLEHIKDNKPVDEQQVIKIFEDNVLKIVRRKLNKQ